MRLHPCMNRLFVAPSTPVMIVLGLQSQIMHFCPSPACVNIWAFTMSLPPHPTQRVRTGPCWNGPRFAAQISFQISPAFFFGGEGIVSECRTALCHSRILPVTVVDCKEKGIEWLLPIPCPATSHPLPCYFPSPALLLPMLQEMLSPGAPYLWRGPQVAMAAHCGGAAGEALALAVAMADATPAGDLWISAAVHEAIMAAQTGRLAAQIRDGKVRVAGEQQRHKGRLQR